MPLSDVTFNLFKRAEREFQTAPDAPRADAAFDRIFFSKLIGIASMVHGTLQRLLRGDNAKCRWSGSNMRLQAVRLRRRKDVQEAPVASPRTISPPQPRLLMFATVILWSVAYAGWTASWTLRALPFALDRSLRRFVVCVAGALLCVAIGSLLERIRGRSVWHTAFNAVIAVIVAVTAEAFVFEFAFSVIVPRWGGFEWHHVVLVMVGDYWPYAAWVLLYFALSAEATRRDRETQLAHASSQAIDAQHQLLVQQINPHFLFNALNTVYALVLENENMRARRSLLALSAFLRRSLETDVPRSVTLARELESVRDYLEIETARFDERLQLVENIPEPLLTLQMPNLILQPLVENCVKHGLQHDDGTISIALTAVVENGTLTITVENEGPITASAPTHGIGLHHVAQRLHLLYGDAGEVDAHPRAGGGFVARIRLPANK